MSIQEERLPRRRLVTTDLCTEHGTTNTDSEKTKGRLFIRKPERKRETHVIRSSPKILW